MTRGLNTSVINFIRGLLLVTTKFLYERILCWFRNYTYNVIILIKFFTSKSPLVNYSLPKLQFMILYLFLISYFELTHLGHSSLLLFCKQLIIDSLWKQTNFIDIVKLNNQHFISQNKLKLKNT